MAWETRNGRGRYYTRSRRVGGRVVRDYLRIGLIAEMAASEDAQKRSRRLTEREAWNARCVAIEATSDAVERFSAGVRATTRSTLEAAGYHQHHRGEWRQRND
jgi:hypothetical protein